MDTNLTIIASFEVEFRKARWAAERAIEQVSDADLHAPRTDFLTTDGNKPGRDRDAELMVLRLSRTDLLAL
ncbi:MAG: hypothetical protein JWM57_1553 [Phycisphaerales bacterium]|nr:hypothetical protein [Phycisphaerales bacterium]